MSKQHTHHTIGTEQKSGIEASSVDTDQGGNKVGDTQPQQPPFGDFLVYADESGDHGLVNCDAGYPLFVLAFCIIRKGDYADKLAPAMLRFKFNHFGHGLVVLHEHEIRKAKGDFAFLTNKAKRDPFFSDLNAFMECVPVSITAAVIRKKDLNRMAANPDNPYNIALELGLKNVTAFLETNRQRGKLTPLICESRGHQEDKDLELAFYRITAGTSGLKIHFAKKRANLPGLQVADLIAHPIGCHVLNPSQPNRAFDILAPKLLCDSNGRVEDVGVRVFPPPAFPIS